MKQLRNTLVSHAVTFRTPELSFRLLDLSELNTCQVAQALRQRWRDIDLTVQEGLDRLASLCLIEVIIGGRAAYHQVPTPRDDVRRLFEAADVAVPAALPLAPARVATKQNLPQRRKVK